MDEQNAAVAALWHTAQAEPKPDSLCLGHYAHNVIVTTFRTPLPYSETWAEYVTCTDLIEWAYIEDLLPQKGQAQ